MLHVVFFFFCFVLLLLVLSPVVSQQGGCFHSRTAMGMFDHVREAVEKGEVLLEWDYAKVTLGSLFGWAMKSAVSRLSSEQREAVAARMGLLRWDSQGRRRRELGSCAG